MRCAITRHDPNNAASVLNSWEEIAAYLERGVRTVQRWEQELHSPVHLLQARRAFSLAYSFSRESVVVHVCGMLLQELLWIDRILFE